MTSSALRRVLAGRKWRSVLAGAILIVLAALSVRSAHYALAAILIVIGVGVALAYGWLVVKPARIPRDSVLMLRISGTLRDEPRRSPLDQLLGRGFPSLYHIRHALEAACTDPRLQAVVVEVAGLGNGLATAEELHELLRGVQAAGKPVVAIAHRDSVSLRDYLVAAGAGQVVMNPGAMLAMLGVAAGSVFLKRALERLGVRVQTLQWKEYKGAAEIFSREDMSPHLRESLEAVISDWREVLVRRIAQARKIDGERAQRLVAAGFLSSREALEAGLVDREGYLQDVRAEMDPADQHKKFVSLARYARRVAYLERRGRRHRIALVCASGPVVAGQPPSGGEFISAETTGAQIERASRDPSVRAIVLRINSPGGSAVGSDLMWRAVRAAQGRGKPVVASMADVAGSGGYYLAACADAIVAEPFTLTGSIGVVFAKPDFSPLLAQLGIGVDVAKTDPVSDALSMARSMSEKELGQLNDVLARVYGNFTSKVAEGRHLSPEATEQVARGRVWSGVAAHARGLVDALGGLARAVEIAREKAGIQAGERHQLISYAQPRLIEALRLSFTDDHASLRLEPAATALGVPAQWIPVLAHLALRGGVMMLAPWLG